MRSFILYLCFLTLCLFVALPASANHIAGSDMYYRFVKQLPNGNNQYEITLIEYYDCIQLNNPNAPNRTPQDDGLAIYVFNNDNNSRTDRFTVSRTEPVKKLDPVLVTKCAEVNYDHCVEILTFKFLVDYRPNTKGYTVVWQRCCRNSVLVNIVKPLDVGNTFMVVLPGTANDKVNNSAVFRQQPLTVICSGFDIEYDMGATDADGDSLTYELVPAFNSINNQGVGATPGASLTDIIGVISGPPPYQTAKYNIGYSFIQPFGPNSNTYLDRRTGHLTINANSEGWHVVTIKVKEYRKGKVINEIYRDFMVFVSVKCKLKQLPVKITYDTKNLTPMANDTFLIKLNTDFCVTWTITDSSNLNTRFSYQIGGIFKDSTKFQVTQVGDTSIKNPLTLQICATVKCEDLFDVYKATIKAVPINECAVKNNKEKEIYFKVIPADSLLPRMKVEAPDLRQEKDSIWIPLSGESCFFVKMWNSAKIKDKNEYNLFPSFPINSDYWRFEKSLKDDTTVFKICLKLGCTWLEDQYMDILTRVIDECGGISTIEQRVFFKIDAPRFDPMVFEYTGLENFGKQQDTLLIQGAENVCFQAKLTTDPFSLGLKMKIKVNRLDRPNGNTSFVEITNLDSLNAMIRKQICIKTLCDNRDVALQIIFTGIDSVTCDYVRTLNDTLYIKNLNTYIRPIRLRIDPFEFTQNKDTLFLPIGKKYCAKIILNDTLNRGNIEFTFSGPLFQTFNAPTTEPLKGVINLESYFCWNALCENLGKTYPVRVIAKSVNPCKEFIFDTLDFFVKVYPEVNEMPVVRFNASGFNINELMAGDKYCFQAVVYDPDSIDGLRSEVLSEIIKDGFDYDKGATVQIDGKYYQTVDICYTPNCHSAKKEHWIKVCGTEQTLCSGSRTVCDSIKVGVKDCFTGFPNVFTPNGDGINELFLPADISAIERYQIQIFDRWGTLMYESTNLNGWNGKRNNDGNPASEGVYFFVAKFRYFSGNKAIEGDRVGSFTLLR